MVTMAVLVAPAVKPSGSMPKPRYTPSPWWLSVSSYAVIVKNCLVSPRLKVMLDGAL